MDMRWNDEASEIRCANGYGLAEVGLECRVRNVLGCDVGWEEGVTRMCLCVCKGCV